MKPVGWNTVIRVMGYDRDAMRTALSRYRAAGYKPESFDTQRKARELLCDCLTAYQDLVEHKRGEMWVGYKREARDVRRRLEFELCP